MAISTVHGRFALDCWRELETPTEEVSTLYCDNLLELRTHAEELFAKGTFKYLELTRWDAEAADWAEIEVFGDDEG